MNAWDYVMMELVRTTRSGWDWSFIDVRILWPIAYSVGICILLIVLDRGRRPGDGHDHESSRESSATHGRREQGV